MLTHILKSIIVATMFTEDVKKTVLAEDKKRILKSNVVTLCSYWNMMPVPRCRDIENNILKNIEEFWLQIFMLICSDEY